MNEYGYARVSSREQKLDRQVEEFVRFGIPEERIYTEKQSGKDFERKTYLRLVRKLKKGDLLVIKSIDRLGRNYDMICEEWARITKHIGADIVVIDIPILDTRTRPENLIGQFISDIVLQILSFVAQQEREFIHARQAEGIAIAKSKGVKFGRPSAKTAQFDAVAAQYINGVLSLTQALDAAQMAQTTFHRYLRNANLPDNRLLSRKRKAHGSPFS